MTKPLYYMVSNGFLLPFVASWSITLESIFIFCSFLLSQFRSTEGGWSQYSPARKITKNICVCLYFDREDCYEAPSTTWLFATKFNPRAIVVMIPQYCFESTYTVVPPNSLSISNWFQKIRNFAKLFQG